jgi:hypothetical protein
MVDVDVGTIANELTFVVEDNPLLIGDQLPPASMVLNAPPLAVPAYSVDGALGSMMRARTVVLVSPLFIWLQLPAPFVVLKTPPPPAVA